MGLEDRASISPLTLLDLLKEVFFRAVGGQRCTAGIPSSPRRGGLGLRPIYSPALFLGLGLAPLLGPSSVSQAGLAGRWPLGAEAPPTCPGILLLLWAQGGRNVAAGKADTSTNLYELSPLSPRPPPDWNLLGEWYLGSAIFIILEQRSPLPYQTGTSPSEIFLWS